MASDLEGGLLILAWCALATLFIAIGFKCMLTAAHALQFGDQRPTKPILQGALAYAIAACCIRWAVQGR